MQPQNTLHKDSIPHGNLLVYKRTLEFTHPLILIFGREPNTKRPIGNFIETYDFKSAPNCGFWNSSYSLVARKTGFVSTRRLKDACFTKQSSPIAYADALPFGLSNDVLRKSERRKRLEPRAISSHVNNIFSHCDVIDRVSLILLSGLDAPEFQTAVRIIDEHIQVIQRRRILEAITVRFFTSYNALANRIAVCECYQPSLKSVIDAWMQVKS